MDLAPDITYFYRIVVEAADRGWPSNPSGRLSFSLSPVVLLDVEVDPQRGAGDLTWSRFEGARFDAYRVERRAGDEEDFTPVGQKAALDDTTFTDSGLDPDQSYFYHIVVEAAGQEWISNRSSRIGYSLTGSQLLDVRMDAQTGTAALTWTAYTGPDFEAY